MALKWTVKSTQFIKELQNRQRSFKGRKLSLKLIVPPEMRWWYFLEFGTRGGYEITPHNPPFALRWFNEFGAPVVRDSVIHPGIRPRAFVRKAMDEIKTTSLRQIYAALQNEGFRYSTIKGVLDNQVSKSVKDIVVNSLAAETKTTARTDTGAKLPGLTAAEAFQNRARVDVTTT